jgi:hypothetical protein
MTTEATRATTSTRSRATNGADHSSTLEPVQAAFHGVRSAIEGVSRAAPDVARLSRGAVDDLVRAIETGSDERVSAGVSISLGMAIGMLLGGAPRILILAALAPVAIMGIFQTERRTGRSRSSSGSAA